MLSKNPQKQTSGGTANSQLKLRLPQVAQNPGRRKLGCRELTYQLDSHFRIDLSFNFPVHTPNITDGNIYLRP